MSNIIRFRPNPITDYLTTHWESIRDEYINQKFLEMGIDVRQPNLDNIYSTKPNQSLPIGKDKKITPFYNGNILSSTLYMNQCALSPSEKKLCNWGENEIERIFNDRINAIPTLKKWMDMYSQYCSSVWFATAQPGSQIRHHYGVDSNLPYFRIHLGLITDPGAFLDIENERYCWKDGELIGFDDILKYHGMKHKGVLPRTILIIDISRKLLIEHIENYIESPFIPRIDRIPPVIVDW